MPPQSYQSFGKTLAIFVDASNDAMGFAHPIEGAFARIDFDDSFVQKNIIVKEMLAIYRAIVTLKEPCQLRIYSDSMSNIESFRTGRADNDECMMLMHLAL